MRTIITGGTIVTPYELITLHDLIFIDDKIVKIAPTDTITRQKQDHIIRADDLWIAPGFIDVHVHGGDGADAMDATHETIDRLCRFFAKHGVTSYYLTTGAAPQENINAAIDAYRTYQYSEGAIPLGLHLEGPYLNALRKGAQPEEFLRNPDPTEYVPWFDSGLVKLMTIAPEIDGSIELLEMGRERGIEFAVGHSVATYDQMLQAADLGLRQATHTFNGMDPLHHRDPGVVGAVLTDERIYAQIIPDGVHVHPAVVKLLVKVKGVKRTILITDSIRAAGLDDGEYELVGQIITVESGIARATSGSLAGSTLTLDQGVRNVMQFTDVTFREAIAMATAVPAEAMGLIPEKGVLREGSDADIVFLDESLTVMKTIVAGNIIYDNDKEAE